jgi:16S rRNA processing protein RimM
VLPAGRVGRPHGLDGSFHVIEPRQQLLALGTRVVVGDAETEIVSRKGTAEKPILRVGVATSREAVDALRGQQLFLPDVEVPALGEDEFWAEELEGATVVDGDKTLGVVRRLMALPSCEALELDTGLIVPLVRDAVRRVDVKGKTIEVDSEFLGAA